MQDRCKYDLNCCIRMSNVKSQDDSHLSLRQMDPLILQKLEEHVAKYDVQTKKVNTEIGSQHVFAYLYLPIHYLYAISTEFYERFPLHDRYQH